MPVVSSSRWLSAEHELVIVGGFCERAPGQVYQRIAEPGGPAVPGGSSLPA